MDHDTLRQHASWRVLAFHEKCAAVMRIAVHALAYFLKSEIYFLWLIFTFIYV